MCRRLLHHCAVWNTRKQPEQREASRITKLSSPAGEGNPVLSGLQSDLDPGRPGGDPRLEHRGAADRLLLHRQRHHHQVRLQLHTRALVPCRRSQHTHCFKPLICWSRVMLVIVADRTQFPHPNCLLPLHPHKTHGSLRCEK